MDERSEAGVDASGAACARPRRQRRKAARPQELLAAALALFGEQGYAGTSMERVARRAGVSKGTLYIYFENKEALFRAVVEASVSKCSVDRQVDAFNGPSIDLLRERVFGWWDCICAGQDNIVTNVVTADGVRFPELARGRSELLAARSKTTISSAIERGIARGEFRPVDPAVLTQVLVASMQTLLYWRKVEFHGDPAARESEFLSALVDVVTNGISIAT